VQPKRPHELRGAYTLTVDSTVDSGDVPAEEAARIARFIRSEVDAGHRTWGDYLILTRKRSGRLLPYVRALEDLQIPMEVSGAGAFAESLEVQDVALLLRALGDPQDAVALVGVLRGRLFGISDPQLFEWKQAGGWFSIFADRDTAKLRGHPVGQALQTLSMWFRWTHVLPIAAAIERILEDSGYLALAATTPAGVQAGDLLHAVDRVRQIAERGGGLADAADALEADLESVGDVESLPLEPGRTDVVRAMNLHKAKGLEAPVVFLADPCAWLYGGVNRRIVREGATARGWFAIQKSRADGERSYGKPVAEPADWDNHVLQERAFLDAEETRLLYVAATRARDLLVVGRHVKDAKGAWAKLSPFLSKAPELPVPKTVKAPKPQKVDVSAKTRLAAASARHAGHTRACTASWSMTSVTAEAKHIARITRAADVPAADDPSRVVVQDSPAHRADAGVAWGALIHGLLEHAMRHPSSTRDDLRRLATWLTMEEPKLRVVLDEAIDTVERVRRAEFWKTAQAAEPSVEVPFLIGEGRQLLSGVVDLMHRKGVGWMITDYKTDVDSTPERAAAYAAQLESYKKALTACGLLVAGAKLAPVRARE
jgi:ATP-dependent helicase/nuclease subunit A